MLTSNDAEKVPLPLLNRCTVVDLLPVGFQNLCGFARAETARRGLSDASAEAIVMALVHPVARTKYISLQSVTVRSRRRRCWSGGRGSSDAQNTPREAGRCLIRWPESH